MREILNDFLKKHQETLDTVKGIIDEVKKLNSTEYDTYSGIEITILQPKYQWLEKYNNGDIIPMRHSYKGDVMALLEISEHSFSSFFSGYVPYIEKYWGTDNLIIKNHTFNSLDELLNSKVKTLEMVHKIRKNSLKKTGKFFISNSLTDLEGTQVPSCGTEPVWVSGIISKEHPVIMAKSKIKELMYPVYEDAEKNLNGIVVPYTFNNGSTIDLRLKSIEFCVLGAPLNLEVKLLFNFYKNKQGSYGTHRIYSVIHEVLDFKK